MVGRLPYHTSVVEAMVAGQAVVERGGPVAQAMKEMYKRLEEMI